MGTGLRPRYASLLPSTLLDSFRREIDQVFGGVEGTTPEGNGGQWFAPQTNLAETETAYEVSVDLPGMKSGDFQVEWKDDQLWITGERKHEHEEKGKTYHRVERSHGQFRRVITLGRDVDAGHVSAEYKDGVLKVTVPKAPALQAKKIEVKQS